MPKKSKKRATRGQGVIYPRNGIWWCDYSVDGARRRESCETKDRDEALAYLHRKQGRLASGESLTPDRVCVRDLLKLVLEDYEVRKVAQAYICTLKVNSILLPKLGDIKATKLSSARIKEYLEVRLKVVKAATINRELALLHRAFQLGYNHDPPPVARVTYFPKLTEWNPRKGFLKPESYKKLLFELPEELRLLFVVSYHVGLRKGALLRIKWSQVDLKTHTIWMDGRKKNRKPEPVAVPIYGDMVKFIQMQPQTSEYLFAPAANPIRDFRESWALACQRAGVAGLLFHDLRRTAVRNLRRAGVEETVIMKITGHRTRSVFERYNITDETDTREAGRKAEEYLAKEQEEVTQITSQKLERAN